MLRPLRGKQVPASIAPGLWQARRYECVTLAGRSTGQARGFRQGLERQQLLRVAHGIAPVTGVRGHLGQFSRRLAHTAAAAAALLFQLRGELAGCHGSSVAEQAVGVVEVVDQTFGQGQGGAACHGPEAEQLAQREEALAQGIARGVGPSTASQASRVASRAASAIGGPSALHTQA